MRNENNNKKGVRKVNVVKMFKDPLIGMEYKYEFILDCYKSRTYSVICKKTTLKRVKQYITTTKKWNNTNQKNKGGNVMIKCLIQKKARKNEKK